VILTTYFFFTSIKLHQRTLSTQSGNLGLGWDKTLPFFFFFFDDDATTTHNNLLVKIITRIISKIGALRYISIFQKKQVVAI